MKMKWKWNEILKWINKCVVHACYNTLKIYAKTLDDINNECQNVQLYCRNFCWYAIDIFLFFGYWWNMGDIYTAISSQRTSIRSKLALLFCIVVQAA